MNAKSIFLAVSLIAVSGSMSAAHAEGRAAMDPRWQYEPNTYGPESHQNHNRHAYTQPHSVTTGSMPKSNAFLAGLSPSALAPKPVAPSPQPTQAVQAIVSMPHVQAAPFKNDFGAPISEQHANPTAMAPAKAMSGAPRVATNGYAHLRGPMHITSQHATPHAMAPIASYGGNNFSAGHFVPTSSGSGMSANTAVSGTIVSHH